jgi:hypothetical protein
MDEAAKAAGQQDKQIAIAIAHKDIAIKQAVDLGEIRVNTMNLGTLA